jgi:glycerol uptake facilitator-like aquaporin
MYSATMVRLLVVSVMLLLAHAQPPALLTECHEGSESCDQENTDKNVMLQMQVTYDESPQASTDHKTAPLLTEFQWPTLLSGGSLHVAAKECVAMTVYVVAGCGSAMATSQDSGWILQVALTFALAWSALAYAIVGGQINFAITFGLMLAGKCSIVQGFLNLLAQMLGSIMGAIILMSIFPEDKDQTLVLGANIVEDGWSNLNACIGEMIMTFLTVFVVLQTGHLAFSFAIVGCTVFIAHSLLIKVDGCSTNPTRSFGPALVRRFAYKNHGSFQDHWVFWWGPLLGAAAAVFMSEQLA